MMMTMMIEKRPRVTQLFACFLSAETKEEFFILFKFERTFQLVVGFYTHL